MRKYITIFFVFLCAGMSAQQMDISGKVKDNTDSPLPGVSVVIKGTKTASVTDFDGNYTIKANKGDTLIFSFMGMENVEVVVGNAATIDVVLKPGSDELEEVVVTSMGITKDRKKLGYAVQKVSSRAIEGASQNNFMDALNGQVSGVQITSAGGQAGSGTSVIIRGMTSINRTNQPLYVVDGMPLNNDKSDYGGSIGTNRAADLNPDEIASVTVLKGGAATALYGIRAANGAVIITTKKGTRGEGRGLNIQYKTSYSMERANKLHQTTEKFARGRGGTYSNVTHWSWGPAYASNPKFPAGTKINGLDDKGLLTKKDVSGKPIPLYSGNYRRFWQTGYTQRNSISISGGGKNNNFYFSASNLDAEGITRNQTFYNRSFLLNVSQNITDKFRVTAKANYIDTGRNATPQQHILGGLVYWHHMWDINEYPYEDTNGDRVYFSNSQTHPRWITDKNKFDMDLGRFIGNVGLSADINQYIGFDLKVGIDTYQQKRLQIRPFGSARTVADAGNILDVRIRAQDLNTDFILRGAVDIGEDLNIAYLAGGNVFNSRFDRATQEGERFVLRNFYQISNTVTQRASQYRGEKTVMGVYSDVTVGWKDMVFLSGTFRQDWSSTLPLDNNSFSYPSVNLGFVATDLVGIDQISFLKFRGSYSQTANDAGLYSLETVFFKSDPNIAGKPRFSLGNTARNPNIRPEKTSEIEVGLDSKFFDNMIGIDFAWYTKTSIDQIISQPVSNVTGFYSKSVNLGEVKNQGIEVTLSINNPIKVKGLQWNTNFNFTRSRSNVVRIGKSTEDKLKQIITGSAWWWASGMNIIAKEGERFGSIFAYTYKRMDPKTKKEPTTESYEEYKKYPLWLDGNGNPQRSRSQRIVGNTNPDWILAMNSNFRYKGINFGFTFERRQGGHTINGMEAGFIYSGLSKATEDRYYSKDNKYANATKVWGGVDNDGKKVTKAGPLNNNFYSQVFRRVAEGIVEESPWWRLRTIYLGYDLPKSLLEKTGFIRGLNITLTGKNLFLSTPYSGNDPEVSAQGAGNIQGYDDNVIPNTESFEISAKINF